MYKQGDPIVVQSYKHDENLHRIWTNAKVVEHTDERIVIANKRTKVIENNGRFWFTKEPSVTFFYKHHWFNCIGILRKDGTYYYCNIASPYVLDDEALKYIDYDLDIKVQADGSYRVLDRNEYDRHKKRMEYPPKLRRILEIELDRLKAMVENREGPFKPGLVESYYQAYRKL